MSTPHLLTVVNLDQCGRSNSTDEEELVGDEAERAQHKKSDKHLSGRDDVRALHDEEADALVRGQHLRGYDAHEGKAQREPCPGQGPVRPRF